MEGYGKRVLIAEDEESVRRLLAVVLEEAGYTVHAVEDGMEALAEMKKRRFDAVVADYRMPRLDGEQFLLLSRLMWPQTPTVLLSAEHTSSALLARCLHNLPVILKMQGACALVPKPFDSQGLLRTLQSAVEAACSCCSPSSIPREGTNNTLSVAPS